MRRRLNREDLLLSGLPFVHRERPYRFRWRVYEGYQLVDPHEPHAYFRAESSDIGDAYEPIVDIPYLFLEFARLEEQRNPDRALYKWIQKYGLLGLHRYDSSVPDASRYFRFDQRAVAVGPADEYNDQGGPEETRVRVWNEVRQANTVLAYWEASPSGDEEQLEQALFRRARPTRTRPSLVKAARSYFYAEAQKAGTTYADVLIHSATYHAIVSVQEVLRAFAYPYIGSHGQPRRQLPEHFCSPEGLSASWWPRNLLGAMYLQMYWLMTSSADLSRCKHCGRIISYAPPVPIGEGRRGRKPRRDKEFCDSRCRQNYHYHTRIKPARQG